MKSTYSPPGYLNFQELFSKAWEFFSEEHSKDLLSLEGFIGPNTTQGRQKILCVFDLDNENRQKLKSLLDNPSAQTKLSFSFKSIELISVPWREPKEWKIHKEKKIIYIFQKCEEDTFFFLQRDGHSSKEISIKRKNLANQILATESWQFIRDVLCSQKIEAYIFYDNHLRPIPESTWMDGQHWYQLLVSGTLSISPGQIFRDIMYTLSPPPITGNVFFKEEDVKCLCPNLRIRKTSENVEAWYQFCSSRPSLNVMMEAFFAFGQEKIESIEKKPLQNHMENYAKKCGVTLSDRKISAAATFLRAKEQEEGTSYKMKNKRKQLNKPKS